MQRESAQRLIGADRHVREMPQQQGVVVEHLLEVRDHPGAVDRVARKATGELIAHAGAGDGIGGVGDHDERRFVTGADRVPQQKVERHRRRELRRGPKAGELGVVAAREHARRLG